MESEKRMRERTKVKVTVDVRAIFTSRIVGEKYVPVNSRKRKSSGRVEREVGSGSCMEDRITDPRRLRRKI
jgi:hypothetical protein